MAFAALRWFTTRYRVTPTQVQLKTGVFARQTHTTPLDRVRTVDVTAPVIHRLLGLVRLEIGTGTHGKGLQLDGLTSGEAEALRVALLHRRRAATANTAAAAPTDPQHDQADPASGLYADAPTDQHPVHPGDAHHLDPQHLDLDLDPSPEPEVELARFDPAWVRYAPFTTSGLLTGLAIFGFAQPFLNRSGLAVWQWAEDVAEHTAVLVIVAVALVVVLVVLAVLAMITYVLNYWGLRVVRHGAGTIRVTRGLLTTRATTIEEARLRGVTMGEAVLVRALGGASLDAVSTGLKGEGGGSTLLPPADRAVVARLADDVLGTAAPLGTPLVQHGPRALRRRWTRALLAGAVVLAPFLVAVLLWGWPWWLLVPAAIPLLASVWLAPARYAALGHALVDDELVTRAGALQRNTTVLETRGIIGWTVQQSFFQRRAGLATLAATTAAGDGVYLVTDVPVEQAWGIALAGTPEAIEPFLAASPRSGPQDPGQLDGRSVRSTS
ncbi:PH domain-containing protein [Arsenicicoccus piscis]|uniref:PH domain-containing protein n=1 Tax=Arsenicicoccus piscis TaxID=673954 RepID=UPI0030C6A1EB